MWGEIPGVPIIFCGQPHGMSSWTSRTLSLDTDPHNRADQCQEFQTALPFPLDDGVSRKKGRVNPVDGQTPTNPADGQTNTHGYNTRSKSTVDNVMEGEDLQENPSGVASKKTERNAGGLSHTPVELHRKQLDVPDISPVLQWKESGTTPFGPEVCTASAATRHYWNS